MSEVGDGPFDWDEVGTTIAHQPRTSIYWNKNGQVVIRQEGEVFEDDPYVFFSVESLPALIEALQWYLIESGIGDPVVDRPERATAEEVHQRAGTAPAASGSSGAARQKRYRQRKRNGGGGDVPGITRDAETVTRIGGPELFSQAAE
jgi:hypothetical protein